MRRIASRHRASISSPVIFGRMSIFRALSTQRWLWRSRSGATPPKDRPPSKTEEPSQKAWSIGPVIFGSSVNHVPSYQNTPAMTGLSPRNCRRPPCHDRQAT
jgi:hypothetical protein